MLRSGTSADPPGPHRSLMNIIARKYSQATSTVINAENRGCVENASADMAALYTAEIAAARAMIDSLVRISAPDLTADDRALLAELVSEAIERQRFSLS